MCFKENLMLQFSWFSLGAEAHKIGKVVSFWPNFDLNFTDIWRA